jgi:dTDP-4-dehydrorhamnose reductase
LRILISGASGFVGGHLWPRLVGRHDLVTVGRRALAGSPFHLRGDLEKKRTLDLLTRAAPEIVVHLAALTDADRCEEQPERALRVNDELPARLATAVEKSCRRFIHVSTDLVFDGENGPYAEGDPAFPASVYGRTKLAGEIGAAAALGERASVVRLALVYGPRPSSSSRPSFLERMLERASSGARVRLFEDEFRTPLYVEDAALAIALLVELPSPPALLHLGGPERCSRFDMGTRALAAFGLASDLAFASSRAAGGRSAPRPRDVSLDSSLARELGLPSRSLGEGLESMRRRRSMVGSEITVPEEEANPL